MKAFVLDASLTMEWFGGTPSAGALKKRSLFDDRVAVVPHLWRFEVMNVLTTWRRRGDITGAQGSHILHNVMQLPFAVIDEGSPEAVVDLATRHEISAYDASYLRAAILTSQPLASLDRQLIRAAKSEGIECL
jgi:predicted nucleic acid-binding protein